jgi:hypothetical protein
MQLKGLFEEVIQFSLIVRSQFIISAGASARWDNGCSGQKISANCDDQVVQITSANYYQKKARPRWKCRQSAYYAALDAMDDVVPQCNSKSSCQITVPTQQVGVWQGQNYMEVEYECKPSKLC